MDYEFIPKLPYGAVLPESSQAVALIVNIILDAFAVAYLIWKTRKRGDLVGLYVMIGCILAILYEPLADYLVLVYYPPQGQITSIEAIGRKIPLYLHLAYVWYLGPFAVYFLDWAKRGISRRAWWGVWGAILVLATVFEEICIYFGLWTYYGEQPFRILQLPLWIPFTFVCFVFAIAAGVYGIVNFLPRRYYWLIMLAVPMLITGAHTSTSLPAATALNTTNDTFMLYVASTASIVISILFIWSLSLFFIPARHKVRSSA